MTNDSKTQRLNDTMPQRRVRTLKLVVEYDGSDYLGWQVQPRGPTIQGVLEEKIALLTGQRTPVTASGRTDAGVHALNQVAHLRTESQLEVGSFQKALNRLLPPDILIKKIEEVEEGFHARKDARSKLYVYRILNRPLRSPFHRTTAWHIPQNLDLPEMKRATEHLLGEHDFSAFRSVGSPTRTAVRRVLRAEWMRGRDGVLRFEIEATGFLKQMVRAIVGTLVEVGKGKKSATEFQGIMESKDRKKAGPTAPARGLFLKEIRY
jgi:tRNA pseudouridine38-40 synthase